MTTKKGKKNYKKSEEREILINSRRWRLKKNPKKTGAYFQMYGKDGKGVIELGTKWPNKPNIVDVLIHEILEASMVGDFKRYQDSSGYNSPRDYSFFFDHDYLHQLGHKVGEALRSIGLLNDDNI